MLIMPPRSRTHLDFILRPSGFTADFAEEPETDPEVERIRRAFEEDRFKALYDISFREALPWFSPSLSYLHEVGSSFVAALARTPDIDTLRERAIPAMDPEGLRKVAARVPFVTGSEYVDSGWVATMWMALLGVYRDEMSSHEGSTELYFAEKNQDLRIPGRIFFHLVEDRKNDAFAFLATYSSKKGDAVTHHPLGHALKEYAGDSRGMLSLLSCLDTVSERSGFISGLMESGELFHPLSFSSDDAYTFLKEVPVYEESGVICRIPNWWRNRKTNVEVGAVIGRHTPSAFGAEALLSVEPSISVDGVPMTEDEIRELLEMGDGLAFIKGKWVEVNRSRLERALRMFESVEEGSEGMTLAEAFRATVGLEKPAGMEEVEFTNGEWLDSMLLRMKEAAFEPPETPDSLHAELRPYQGRGVGWMYQLRSLGFGACLADDMGLGKTVQVLALLETIRRTEGGRHLLIVPTSLMGNWEREIAKFTPDMDYRIVHGSAGPTADDAFLTITTYGTVRTRKELAEVEWDSIILDEAQAIKNPGTKQTTSIKALKGGFRLAMTGTPVENGLGDMWSLFDFIDKGLLGTAREFDDFTRRLADDPDGYRRLRETTAPFILRRLKTDKRIIDDLPDKNVIDIPVQLTQGQGVLYKDYSRKFLEALGDTPPGMRSGLILGAITKFKQICDHTDLYLGTGGFEEKGSGKFAQLRQICETVRDNGERVLVFTQYRELTEPLAAFLKGVFGRDGLVLHGGTRPKDRQRMVERFNSDSEYIPFMVLSLKAGGVGLNLTGANHVVHFDRWWNPAVENQATDRAFRIGQRKDVMVYRMTSLGTIEEKIAKMIEDKTDLAEKVVGAGEKWIAELDDSSLRELFTLG